MNTLNFSKDKEYLLKIWYAYFLIAILFGISALKL